MKKNASGQKIGAQLVSASDGSAFTGSVTVYVTGDAGTQAVGSVGSGACTHEGNGYHTYAPDQAETNYDLIAFTFIGTGAIPSTVQVMTDGAKAGDQMDLVDAPNSTAVDAIQSGLALAANLVDLTVTTGTVQTDGGNSATQIKTDLAATDDNFYRDAYCLITSGDLAGQVRLITGYNGTSKALAVKSFTDTPADATTFAIINR